ncbi:class I SAM-dependent methyltransferase [Nocardia cerradoensis]|uniref:Aklanonic acid methyltransferase DauC n=1 Tax=Nocardia cerradoensis TaxID=85688 RepID=A0A231H6B8_9NOCA|nr:class I SAM-dependent methyltransferase [Nocardia cerradoensis]NKY44019.1 class I SAM-dependent methyltransferase [Nocardia cerradoensis]OXR44266.1 Aklanonic acid methyltransferase DauC [Nocardia cerradoensis]
MTHIVNTAQSEAWNGYEGEHWADHADRYDAVNSGINEPLLAAAKIAPGDRVLDIGCGNGQLTRAAARRAASATGVDLSGPMLARARLLAEAEGVHNVSFEQGDAQVFGFAPGSYDVATSRFGIMFFADPVAAFTNISRALGPGGRLAVAVPAMADSEIAGVFAAAAAHLPGFEVGHGFSAFADAAATADLLGAAGFADVGNELVVTDSVWGADVDDATEFVVGWGPVRYHRLRNDFGTDAEVRAAVAAALAPFAGDGPVRLRAASRLVTATVALP